MGELTRNEDGFRIPSQLSEAMLKRASETRHKGPEGRNDFDDMPTIQSRDVQEKHPIAEWHCAEDRLKEWQGDKPLAEGWRVVSAVPDERVTFRSPEGDFTYEVHDGRWCALPDAPFSFEGGGRVLRKIDKDKIRYWTPSLQPQRGIDRLLGNIIAKAFVTVIAAAGGSSKSTLLGHLSIGIAKGMRLVGPWVREPANVLHLGIEDDQDMNDRMLKAAADHHIVRDFNIDKNLVIMGSDTFKDVCRLPPSQSIQLIVMHPETKQPTVDNKMTSKIKAIIQETKAEAVMIDPMSVLYGGTQMTNEVMNLIVRTLADIAKEMHVVIVVVSHTRKGNGGRQGRDDVKFGTELVDTARCVLMITELPQEQQKQWASVKGVPVDELDGIRHARVVKTNIGDAKDHFYYGITTTTVACADGKKEEVPVLDDWTPPSVATICDLASWGSIRERIEAEFVSPSPQSAGVKLRDVVAEECGEGFDPNIVAANLFKDGWVAEEMQVNPNGSKGKVKRAVVGPNAPD